MKTHIDQAIAGVLRTLAIVALLCVAVSCMVVLIFLLQQNGPLNGADKVYVVVGATFALASIALAVYLIPLKK